MVTSLEADSEQTDMVNISPLNVHKFVPRNAIVRLSSFTSFPSLNVARSDSIFLVRVFIRRRILISIDNIQDKFLSMRIIVLLTARRFTTGSQCTTMSELIVAGFCFIKLILE